MIPQHYEPQRFDTSLIEDGALLFEPREDFDKCIVGYNEEKNQVQYLYEWIIEMYMQTHNWTVEEATEWVDYNTVRSCRYITNAPSIIAWDYEEERYVEITDGK